MLTRHMQDGLSAAGTAVGLAVLDGVQRAELDEKVGPKGKHRAEAALKALAKKPDRILVQD